jgi:hypothetical protein
MSTWIEDELIDQTRYHTSEHWSKPVNLCKINRYFSVRFGVSMVVSMKNVVFWDINPSSYFTGDTLCVCYRTQPVNAIKI